MTSLPEMLEKFCWRSKIQSIWKNEPDLFDEAITHIHSEAAVFDAIIRSKNATLPSWEKITQTIQFLEQNTFWRSNPFSLLTNFDDPQLALIVKKLKIQDVKDIWKERGDIMQPQGSEEMRRRMSEAPVKMKTEVAKFGSAEDIKVHPAYGYFQNRSNNECLRNESSTSAAFHQSSARQCPTAFGEMEVPRALRRNSSLEVTVPLGNRIV
ncbi:hypothetical protein SprV_0100049200 [Sparganum proliferum]